MKTYLNLFETQYVIFQFIFKVLNSLFDFLRPHRNPVDVLDPAQLGGGGG